MNKTFIFLYLILMNSIIAGPNLIIILTDDQGYQDVGFNGCKDIPTPHLDSIAQNGVNCIDAHVSYPVCGPSRAGLLTGRYQDRFGFTTNPTVNPENPIAGLPLEEKNIAEVLKEVGYSSSIIGKWHMGTHPIHHPLNRGFDHFFGFLSGGHDYFPAKYNLKDLSEVKRIWDWYRTHLIRDRERIQVSEGYLTDILTDAAVDFIDKKASEKKPFMLYLSYNAPHTPLQASEKYLKRFTHIKDSKRRTYAAMVSAVDDGVGRVMARLKKHKIEEDTLVFFLSDNGGPLKGPMPFTDNGPFSKGKGSLHEGGTRVPFAVQWKGTIPSGQIYKKPMSSLDILATITALNKLKPHPKRPLDGVNIIPYLTGQKSSNPHDKLFWRKLTTQGFSLRQGNYKILLDNGRRGDSYQLYDLSKDPGEQQDLKNKKPELAKGMFEEWKKWEKELKNCIFPTLEEVWWDK
ncbi:N-acetylgalactosamine 6-sulfatase (GALNS) [Lentisphaera araneosa HTCC2155]|uniref:N-acetylgalactosamine 6-sulfatase (GALNS) n=1 Tax=Lentisphaera araneosa HTCC2155 TaxID=313628 RepID=A6DNB0_9BACT|nr:sulfatase-like hydrolase/transferase [Lentisphaera araneosa]EDM26858.1 N-acetylgalactosamine 6-sulfatase (GALNS) [Lentisphaera araneosa HTCC2155]